MPTTPAQALATITTRLRQAIPNVSLLGSNETFAPPVDQPWLRLSVLWGVSTFYTMEPTRTNLNPGLIQVDIFVPRGDGLGRQEALGAEVRLVFNRQEFSSVRCEAASGLMGLRPDDAAPGVWWVASIRVPFSVIEEV